MEEFDDGVRVYVPENTVFKRINFIALPYPGYPTDMQPQLCLLYTSKAHALARACDYQIIHLKALAYYVLFGYTKSVF